MIAFAITLALLSAAALILRDRSAATVAFALLANWAVCSGMVALTGENLPWIAFAAVDYVTAVALVLLYGSLWQVGVIGLCALQLVSHVAFGMVGENATSAYYYYWLLSYIAWGQAAIVGGRIGGSAYRVFRVRRDPDGRVSHPVVLRGEDR